MNILQLDRVFYALLVSLLLATVILMTAVGIDHARRPPGWIVTDSGGAVYTIYHPEWVGDFSIAGETVDGQRILILHPVTIVEP